MRSRPPQYRLNRRAALILGTSFAIVGGLLMVLVAWQSQPERQLAWLRESAADYRRQGAWQQVVLQLANVVRLAPEDEEDWLRLAEAYLRLGDDNQPHPDEMEAAIACLRQVALVAPDNLEAHRWLLDLELRLGNWDAARNHLTHVRRLAPDDPIIPLACELMPPVRQDLIDLVASDSRPEALEELRGVIDEHPGDWQSAIALALAEGRNGNNTAARDVLRRTEQQGTTPRIAAHLEWANGELACLEADWRSAQRHVTNAIALDPECRSGQKLRASLARRNAMEQVGHGVESAREAWELAAEAYRELIYRAPDDLEAANEAAWILGVHLGRIEEGLELLDRVRQQSRDVPSNVADTEGWLLWLQGNGQDAVDRLRLAHEQQPDDPTIRLHLAVASLTQGDWTVIRELVPRSEAIPPPLATSGGSIEE